jgi:hypothetical protein
MYRLIGDHVDSIAPMSSVRSAEQQQQEREKKDDCLDILLYV